MLHWTLQICLRGEVWLTLVDRAAGPQCLPARRAAGRAAMSRARAELACTQPHVLQLLQHLIHQAPRTLQGHTATVTGHNSEASIAINSNSMPASLCCQAAGGYVRQMSSRYWSGERQQVMWS